MYILNHKVREYGILRYIRIETLIKAIWGSCWTLWTWQIAFLLSAVLPWSSSIEKEYSICNKGLDILWMNGSYSVSKYSQKYLNLIFIKRGLVDVIGEKQVCCLCLYPWPEQSSIFFEEQLTGHIITLNVDRILLWF